MSEFCKDCFLKLNPQFEEKDLVIIKDDELCEGCEKVVKETVLKVKDNAERKLKKNASNQCN